jgi:Xaa-Pro aminopeptidase
LPPSETFDDKQLEGLLKQAKSGMSVEKLREFCAGVAGAPTGHDAANWVELVINNASNIAADELVRYVADMRNTGFGLGESPAPASRLSALRKELATQDLDGFIIPLADEHQGEFIPPRARRLAWLTGFTGSAGMAVVLKDKAAIFVDGRYTLQVRDQIDDTLFDPQHVTETPPHEWIAMHMPAGAVLGYDPWLHTPDGVARIHTACDHAQAHLKATDINPVDAVWENQPARPLTPAVNHEPQFAGTTSKDKRDAITAELAKLKADAVVLTAPESICWLLNLRGGDVPNTPLTLCFAVLTIDGVVHLFIDDRKFTATTRQSFGNQIQIKAPDQLGPMLDSLGKAGHIILLDSKSAPSWVFDRLKASGADIIKGDDPCTLPKSCKNETELAGTREAHIRDGAALCRFLSWLSREGPTGRVDELSAVDKLYGYRAENDLFHGVSFETISGAGPNGAIVHYHAEPASNRKLEPGMVYLVDSGGQYLDGTTDVTRTVFIPGPESNPAIAPPSDSRDRFTRVLQGHIALAQACFPSGTSGGQLDTLARAPLWRAGCDYDHGTGHGVGSYLGVHEGPARIGKQGSTVPLRPGMIMSNEPGYYKTGEYGIRIENLVIVRQSDNVAGGREMLELETITLAPIDRALIDGSLMTRDEIAWLDAYHDRVRKTLTPLVDPETATWLKAATAPLI